MNIRLFILMGGIVLGFGTAVQASHHKAVEAKVKLQQKLVQKNALQEALVKTKEEEKRQLELEKLVKDDIEMQQILKDLEVARKLKAEQDALKVKENAMASLIARNELCKQSFIVHFKSVRDGLTFIHPCKDRLLELYENYTLVAFDLNFYLEKNLEKNNHMLLYEKFSPVNSKIKETVEGIIKTMEKKQADNSFDFDARMERFLRNFKYIKNLLTTLPTPEDLNINNLKTFNSLKKMFNRSVEGFLGLEKLIERPLDGSKIIFEQQELQKRLKIEEEKLKNLKMIAYINKLVGIPILFKKRADNKTKKDQEELTAKFVESLRAGALFGDLKCTLF